MKKFTKRQKRSLRLSRMIGVSVFAVTLAAGSVTGLMFFARPSVSALENRNLTEFPAFTLSSFLDGSWFSGISFWYSDTFPGREKLMKVGLDLKKSYGIQAKEAVLTTAQADALPPADSNSSQASSESSSQEKKFSRTTVPDTYIPEADVQNQIMQGTMLKDGAIYSGCYFVQESADAWFDIVNSAAKALEGTSTVYSILIPNNSGAILEDSEMEQLGGTDQKQEIEYYYSNYSDLVHPVDAMSELREHRNEYIYFRTDHHWTADGAWYAYDAFCKAKGIESHPRESFQSQTFEPYYGSYSGQFPGVDLIADSVVGYIPNSTNDMVFYDNDPTTGKTTTHPTSEPIHASIFETSPAYGETGQYMRFAAGDRGFAEIDNPQINDGSSCLIVKESFGNSFIPFLVDHYDKIYIVDFRYNSDNLINFCKEKQIQDLILLNNIQLIGGANVVATYQNLLNTEGV